MSYMSNYYLELTEYLRDHPEQAHAGQVITLTVDTHEGKKVVQHEVTESDLDFLKEAVKDE
jgi:hypothetical protein